MVEEVKCKIALYEGSKYDRSFTLYKSCKALHDKINVSPAGW